ncbi:DsbE family thiol:disulfide interchange protein [Azospirillum sp. RWY-5-1]|uniref:DsbE family thiol:disulfide interchange protein n=1 Tax=Azospirillum oleiclasticum TaxID=2735135 RepID=A0ABX2TA84_9PROT|nr:DsbE family thiol:disulfide interchange protein [Azospirillum oleiclasticum]NYZ15340.1 DsbE family thiol:disulfide interchange protein [Azospirillum oleiclasticum]NYZ21239.1 DsbE family thiol:disulfide interchange protein [Azospirillum oleiclasticum]
MRRLLFILPLLLFVGVAVAFYLGFNRDPREIPSVLIDKPVPEFALPALPGYKQGLATADLKGDVQLVNVFASWCVPCKIEHPVITRLSREQGVPVRAINHKDKAEDAIAWLKRNGDPYAGIGQDLDGRVSIDWGVYGVPETFLIDRQGRIRYKHVGPLSPEVVERDILPLVKELRKG